MEMEDEKFRILLQKYNNGSCTDEEKVWLESWYLQKTDQTELPGMEVDEAKSLMWNVIDQQTRQRTTFRLWPKLAVAASLLIATAAGVWFYQSRIADSTGQPANNIVYKNDVKPGGIRATLTLADGSKITLDDAKNGALAVQTGIKVTKTADGQLLYTISDTKSSGKAAFNTIETPKGGQYQVKLPDGTQVWLNSASTVKFPLSFAGSKTRAVELSGEAYFEVAHNKLQPFIVKTTKQEVEVLGTHFNVNAYPSEPVAKTTLLEGSVRLNGGTMLKPGQQGLTLGGTTQVKEVNTDEQIDWKNKQFILNNEDLQVVMRRLSRWYDVDVIYEGKPEDLQFVGVMSSTRNISGVLKLMERTGKVHFKIEGRTITVLKNP